MSDMKCPFCGNDTSETIWEEANAETYCPHCDTTGDTKLWQELDRTRKALDESEHCCTEWEKQALDYKAENIKLSTALDVAVDALKLFDSGQYTPEADAYGLKTDASRVARKALEQIESITKKD